MTNGSGHRSALAIESETNIFVDFYDLVAEGRLISLVHPAPRLEYPNREEEWRFPR